MGLLEPWESASLWGRGREGKNLGKVPVCGGGGEGQGGQEPWVGKVPVCGGERGGAGRVRTLGKCQFVGEEGRTSVLFMEVILISVCPLLEVTLYSILHLI